MRASAIRFRQAARKLARDCRGATIVEMGLVAPVLGLFVVGIIDLSQAVSQQFTNQQAIDRSLHMLIANPPAGNPGENGVDYSYLAAEAAAAAGIAEEQVALSQWLECDGIRQDDFAGTCASGEEIARYVSLRISDTFTGTAQFGEIALIADGAVRIQ